MKNIIIGGEKINYEEIKSYYRHSIFLAFRNLFSTEQVSTMLEKSFNDLLLIDTYDTEELLSNHLFTLLSVETNKIRQHIAANQIMSLRICFAYFSTLGVEIKKAIALSDDLTGYPLALHELNKYKISLLIKGDGETVELIERLYTACERKLLGIGENAEIP